MKKYGMVDWSWDIDAVDRAVESLSHASTIGLVNRELFPGSRTVALYKEMDITLSTDGEYYFMIRRLANTIMGGYVTDARKYMFKVIESAIATLNNVKIIVNEELERNGDEEVNPSPENIISFINALAVEKEAEKDCEDTSALILLIIEAYEKSLNGATRMMGKPMTRRGYENMVMTAMSKIFNRISHQLGTMHPDRLMRIMIATLKSVIQVNNRTALFEMTKRMI